jgi:hypothetical protein
VILDRAVLDMGLAVAVVAASAKLRVEGLEDLDPRLVGEAVHLVLAEQWPDVLADDAQIAGPGAAVDLGNLKVPVQKLVNRGRRTGAGVSRRLG